MSQVVSHQEGRSGPVADAALTRRSFVGHVVAGTTLVVAADMAVGAGAAFAAGGTPILSPPQIPEAYDLNDFLTDCARPTANLISISVDKNGVAHFALPRAEVGQGITTAIAMLIADELDLPLSKVSVSLAKARPELVFNQLTGGSNTIVSMYTPVRVAAAVARRALLEAAAIELDSVVDLLTSKEGVIQAPDGVSVSYADVAEAAAALGPRSLEVVLKPSSKRTIVGRSHNRVDARDIVTGQKKFTMDLEMPRALPTMVCRAPQLNGTPKSVRNLAKVKKMPGVTHVAVIPTGVAVRARTFGQCIDAVRALEVGWNPGSVAGKSDADVLRELRGAELPLAVPSVPVLATTVEGNFAFAFRSGSPLEPNCAIADVRNGKAVIWGGLKSPIDTQSKVAQALGIAQSAVTVNVVTSGGSFGRHLFSDAAIEAAHASKAFGVPVRLMWHRADEPRQGRVHPMATSRIRATVLGDSVLTFEQRHTSVSTDFTHGLGERLTAMATELPSGLGNLAISEGIFTLSQEVPYNLGVVTQLLNEVDMDFNTSAVRNIYSPEVATARELVVDQLARKMKLDPVAFRRKFIKHDEVTAVLDKVAKVGRWGRTMPKGMAQGIAVHREYKGATAVLVEIDCRSRTVNRDLGPETVAGPRVTKAVIAIDCGAVINPRGVEAQMMGGVMDGIALTLTASNHLKDGHFLEASWDNYFYTRQWNVPPSFTCIVMDSERDQPGGVGEAGVAASAAAVACAYARATGKVPTYFPINHGEISFKPKSFVPPVPQSPTNGLKLAR